MAIFDAIIEERIAEAYRRGEFDGLPGAGRPQALDDDLLVPQERRAAYRVLKNAGFVPPEILQLRELREVETQLAQTFDKPSLVRLQARWHALNAALEATLGRSLQVPGTYRLAVAERLAGMPGPTSSSSDPTAHD
ncbi:DnaJ family domain-containing protein [Pandoraea sp.]|uniref:DnaJ family domain-containing protein n=1 Tax=Pandoraea sp. TaxID=1883445 RepID=UPI0012019D7C|nr:DnaJ family domain-containing protein [Pandoraea sp.]TAL52444.1 MAG: DUF1992 domain-containing protein [Pandoraea sp.]TAM16254.1 MAG: DUF1992 domain-containing protein [Pandoraea sp.]